MEVYVDDVNVNVLVNLIDYDYNWLVTITERAANVANVRIVTEIPELDALIGDFHDILMQMVN